MPRPCPEAPLSASPSGWSLVSARCLSLTLQPHWLELCSSGSSQTVSTASQLKGSGYVSAVFLTPYKQSLIIWAIIYLSLENLLVNLCYYLFARIRPQSLFYDFSVSLWLFDKPLWWGERKTEHCALRLSFVNITVSFQTSIVAHPPSCGLFEYYPCYVSLKFALFYSQSLVLLSLGGWALKWHSAMCS